ncbi:MAG: lipopolysaccharide biosynthesis protein [Terracidiphilus sp.]|nr:lipopolysaccharide biosynthesis protein [Terracidiphilus sp.]
MTEPTKNIAASAIRGVRWNYLGGISASLCQLAIGIVLARILGPRPFGQVIIASTIYGFLNLFVDGGFSQALIQKAELSSEDVRKTFTCQVGIGLSTTAVVFAAAPWIARMFHDPTATNVVRVMALMMTIQSTGLVAAALLRRSMRFRAVQMSALCSYLVGFLLLGIPLALRGAGVWSLVAAFLTQAGVNSVLLHCAARHTVKPLFRWPERSIMTFGGTIIANNVVNWGHLNLDNLAASGMGPAALGLYGRGCNFAYQPVNAVVTGLQSVLMSSTARAQGRREVVREMILAVLGIVFGILGPAYAVLAMLPDTTIMGLYGDKWVGVIPLMVPLALVMPFFGAHALLGPVLSGLGRPDLEFWPQALSCAVAAVAFFSAARISLACIAWALLGVVLIRFGAIAGFTFHLLKIRWRDALPMIAGRLALSAVFGGVMWCVDWALRAAHLNPAERLVLIFALSMALLGLMVMRMARVVFGGRSVQFLLAYEQHLPAWYVRRLKKPGIASVNGQAICS